MANLDDLKTELEWSKKRTPKPQEPVEAEVVDDDPEPEEQDILDAFSLLSKCMHLLDYLADSDLCEEITDRERESMGRLSETVRTYLDEVEHYYMPDDDEVNEE